jgi:hypothetical protein
MDAVSNKVADAFGSKSFALVRKAGRQIFTHAINEVVACHNLEGSQLLSSNHHCDNVFTSLVYLFC